MTTSANRVWCPVDDEDAWVLATVDERFGGSVHMKRLHAPEGFELDLMVSDEDFTKLMPVTGKDEDLVQEDLTNLHDVNEAGMLHCLRQRYGKDDIYTGIGPILIAINPYKALAMCSSESIARMMTVEKQEDLSPHIFKIAQSAYTGMIRTGGAQSVLISGESGAGKTETTKLCLSCLASISGSAGVSTEAALESGIVLEAFGNAKTVMNNNSSRFGKWCIVHFDKEGKIAGCKLQSYLLEKSRVVGQSEGERNYHIFYQMCKGSPEQKKKYMVLDDATQYEVLKKTLTAPGIDDAKEWELTTNKLEVFNLEAEKADQLFTAISGVMMLGNMNFEAAGEKQKIANVPVGEKVAKLFSVDLKQMELALTNRTISSGRGSSYTLPLTEPQCRDARDALARAIYTGLFDILITKLNDHMASLNPNAKISDESELFVGLLDVFGFENFDLNGFEQLCINFTNEKLQQHFIDAVVKLQQKDYEREGITCGHIQFPDNVKQIELIEGKKGQLGIMTMLDEECRIQAGSEENYVTKMHDQLSSHDNYTKPKPGAKKAASKGVVTVPTKLEGISEKDLFKLKFLVQHYAGEVEYTAYMWLDKNRGVIQPELMSLMSCSENKTLAACFDESAASVQKDSKGKPLTVGAAFRNSLKSLSATLLQTTARYVRCIKPNLAKVAGKFDGHFVERQLRYTGVGAVIEIQRSGYPVSIIKKDFVARYRCCVLGTVVLPDDVNEATKMILQAIGPKQEPPCDWLKELASQLGKTKVFMRDEVVRGLETVRDAAQDKAAAMIGLAAKAKIARSILKLLKQTKGKCEEIRAALKASDTEKASAALEAVKQTWAAMSHVASFSDSCVRAQRLVGQLEMELHQLEQIIKEESEAAAELQKAIDKKGGDMWFVTLKSALGAAEEKWAENGVVADLKAKIGLAKQMIAEEEQRIKEEEERRKKEEEERKIKAEEAKRKAAEAAAAAKAAEEAAAKGDAESKAKAAQAAAEAKKLEEEQQAAELEAMEQLAATAAKIEEFKKWEQEVERQAKEREAARKEKERKEEEKNSVLGENMERLELTVKNDPDPEKGLGVEFSMQTITAITRGGLAHKEQLLRVGDIIEKVDGVSVRGKKVLSVIPEKSTSVKLTIQRAKNSEAEAGGRGGDRVPKQAEGLSGVEMSGWLFKVKAKDGRAVRLPKKRWVVLQGGTLIWYEDSKGEVEANQQSLTGAVCSMPLRSTGYAMTPAMRAFAELHKFPFMLSWPNGEVGHEIVLAASTNPDRSNWVNALIDAIKRTQNDTPTAGWLFKEGGRKTGIALAGWKKRWFVLAPPGKECASPQLKYLESPQSKKPKGTIILKGSDVFVPKKMRGPSGSSYQHCFCVTSTGQQEGQDATGQPMTTCTLLAASSDEDRQKWIHAVRSMMASGNKKEAKTPVHRASATGIGGDKTAGGLEHGQGSNIEQLLKLEPDELMNLRVKQLLAICAKLQIKQASDALEKKDLVALIVKNR